MNSRPTARRRTPDTTVGDFDDILMFTTRSSGRPFVGKFNGSGTIQSDVAEVAWFVRGRTLHRRVLLVAPERCIPNESRCERFYARLRHFGPLER